MRSAYLRRVLGVWGLLVAVLLVVLMTALAEPFEPESFGPGHDARAYWAVPLDDPYVPGSVGQESAYLYSPAFLVALSPLRALSWPLFLAVWTTGLLAVLFWLARPLLFLPLLLLALPEIWGGNITILLAAALVVGFGRSAAWAFPLLTKLTPGLGILWFAVRREWLAFSLAIAATLAVIAATAVLAPGLWAQWFQLLTSSTGSSTVPGSIPVPLMLRLPVAIVVIVFAAWRGWRWLLPIGVLLAMPVIWWGSLALLTACVALKREEIEARFDALLVTVEDRYHARVAAQRAAPLTN
ncbi:MAG TPA: glycosyltransferase family 87 protein [Anaerolineae bacterium]|nr:glycosyltransferase family 87 protein [Anaerolineae bacterium]